MDKRSTRFFIIISIVIVLGFLAFRTAPQPNVLELTITGNSMLPTYKSGDVVLVDLDHYLTNQPQKNDIIAIKFKTQKDYFIKRIIATPRDTINIKNDQLFVNNKQDQRQETFLFTGDTANILLIQLEREDWIIPENLYLILGDNRFSSLDSTDIGLLQKGKIIGKIIE